MEEAVKVLGNVWPWWFCALVSLTFGLLISAISGGLIYRYSLAWFARIVDVMLGAVR